MGEQIFRLGKSTETSARKWDCRTVARAGEEEVPVWIITGIHWLQPHDRSHPVQSHIQIIIGVEQLSGDELIMRIPMRTIFPCRVNVAGMGGRGMNAAARESRLGCYFT